MTYQPPADAPVVPTRDVEACLPNPNGHDVVACGVDFEYGSCRNTFELRRARSCEIIYVFPQPTPDAMSTIYPPQYEPFRFHTMRGPARWGRDFLQFRKARAILKLAGAHARVLDVGCGAGALLRQLARLRGGTNGLVANDFSSERLAPLRALQFQTLAGAAEDLTTSDRFHVVTMLQVLEHLPAPLDAVRNLARFLHPGGYLMVETPSIDGWDAKLFRRRYWGGYHIPRHFYLFNESSLRQLMNRAGLDVLEVKYLVSPAFWIQSVHHFLLDHNHCSMAALFTLRNPVLLALAVAVDVVRIALGKPTSNIRVVARKPQAGRDDRSFHRSALSGLE